MKRNLELNKFSNVILETIASSDVNEQEVEMSFQPILIMEIAPAWTEMCGDNIMDIFLMLSK